MPIQSTLDLALFTNSYSAALQFLSSDMESDTKPRKASFLSALDDTDGKKYLVLCQTRFFRKRINVGKQCHKPSP